MSGIAFAGVPTAINLVYNGFISGLVLRQISSSGIAFAELYYYGRHHAIEFIALWLSGGIGLCGFSLCRSFLQSHALPDAKFMVRIAASAALVVIVTFVAAKLEEKISIAAYYAKIPATSSTDSLVVISRAAWHAHPAAAPMMQRRDSSITTIVIHHSGFPGTATPLRIQEFQMNIREMDDIAYHYYITSDGCVYEGRPLGFIGQHASAIEDGRSMNDASIGICLGGNFETQPNGPSAGQLKALRHLLLSLAGRFHIDSKDIRFHRDCTGENASDLKRISGTACPGRFALIPLTRLIDSLEVL